MADQHLGPWYLIPTAKVVASLTDPDFFLVRASDVTLVDSNSVTTSTPMRPSTPYINDDTASSAPRAPYSDQTALLPPPSDPGSAEAAAAVASTRGVPPPTGPPPMIRSRPQAGNGQFYFTMLHEWAGRKAGGFGRPAGLLGKGSFARWSHREISSVFDDVTLSSQRKRDILDNYDDASTKLFQRWLTQRNLNNYATENARAPQFSELMDSATCRSHYYQVPLSNLEGEWVRAYHGTYFYVLWNILISGFLGSGLQDEGGDTHIDRAGVVYTTPIPDLAYRYACPHQLFGNGFLYKVVLDLRVMKDRMYKSFNANGSKRYKAEEIFLAHDVRVAGFWLFNDTNAEEGDSRILEWDPKFETIPMEVVESWHRQGADIETAMPNVITDPAPKLMPIDNRSWAADHSAITS